MQSLTNLIMVNHIVVYLGKWSLCSKVVVQTQHSDTHTHSGPIALLGRLLWSLRTMSIRLTKPTRL